MRIAYARCSTTEQTLDLQMRALEQAGYDTIFTDEGVSGTTLNRPGYSAAFDALSPGDTLIVWRLDRLARSMRDLTDTVWSLHNQGISFCSLCESFDLNTAVGQLTLNMLSAIADFERALIIERTKAGMDAARLKGVKFGRKPALDCAMFEEALFLNHHGMTIPEIARHLGVGRSTLYRYLADLRKLQRTAGYI